MKTCTKVEFEERISIVIDCLVKGMRAKDIFRLSSEKLNWNVGMRQIENYIIRANKEFKKSAQKDRDIEFEKGVRRINLIIDKTLSIQDYKTALSAQTILNKMVGLDEPQKIEISQDIDFTLDID